MVPFAAPGTLAVGIQMPIQAISQTISQPWEPRATVADLVAVAQAADRAGFAFVGACDHTAVPRVPYTAHMATAWYDTIATLGFLAAHTRNVRLLSSVYVVANRHPLMTAKAFLTLDHLSEGRAILGVGAGHVEAEFDGLGSDFASRGPRTDEAIDAIRGAFDAEYSSFDGEFFRYDDMGLAPRPAAGPIPIWIGGSGKPALRRVAERGDGWIPQGTPRAQMRECVDYIRRRRDEVRPGAPIDLGFYPGAVYVGTPTWDTGEHTIAGSPERIAESVRDAYDFDCNVVHVHFRSRDADELCDQLTAFGSEVAPLLPQ